MNSPTSTSSPGSADLLSPLDGQASARSASQKSIPSPAQSSESIGPMSPTMATSATPKRRGGAITIITCGDPCQQNSNARQHGTSEESPAIYGLQVIAHVRPDFVLRENPSVVRKDAPWPWWRFRDELELLGYAVLPFRIRACCLGADHRRERMLLLAELPNPNRPRLERHECEELARAIQRRRHPDIARSAWREPASRICRASDGIPSRVSRIEALGNAIDPRVAYPVFSAIRHLMLRS